MKNCFVALSLSLSLLSSEQLLAHGDKDPPHCEKKDKSGTVIDVEAKDKVACKEKSGTWVEPKKDKVHAHEGEHKHDH